MQSLEIQLIQVSSFAYDPLGRRVTRRYDTDGDGDADSNDTLFHEYYTTAWQRIEVRPNDGDTGSSQYLYGLRYVDDIAIRLRDADEASRPNRTTALWRSVVVSSS